MLRVAVSSVPLALWFWCGLFAIAVTTGSSTTPTVLAFAPETPHHERRTISTTMLYMRQPLSIPPPPPPLPPPPEMPADDSLGASLQHLLSDLTSALDRLDLSQVQSKLSGLTLDSTWTKELRDRLDLSQVQAKLFDLSIDSTWTKELQDQVEELDSRVLSQLSKVASSLLDNDDMHPSLQVVVEKVHSVLAPTLTGVLPNWIQGHPTLALLGSTLVSYVVISSALSWNTGPAPSVPYPNGRYDPVAARAYFDSRLPTVIFRAVEIFVQSTSFGIRVLKDYLDNKLEANEFQRGKELARLLTQLGPTFIKVGQSLSIRTDLLSVGYQRGLATLQDQVPAFSTQQATAIVEQAWGRKVTDVLTSPLSDQPVAAASLGQVYKCVIKASEQPVAIKVQRPDIMTQIALDMHLLREVAPILKRVFNLNTDTVGTVDAWGLGFVDELDYLQEGENAEVFMTGIAETPLKDVVFAPLVLNEWTTDKVLVTEWVDGERLDRSSNEDVTILCSIAMNTYLTMLLELSMLHADPHPGNLLRTSDGRLCILDWGMVTRLDADLQLTLIEHVAHLTSADYAEIPRDLLLLGFIPEGKADQIEDSGVVELLADIYSSWTKGGGAAAINVNDVINRLQDLTAEKGNLFQIPPYFAYIAKSFSVLEGIGLCNDPKYSIINECLPYISKRLLTDKDKMGPALSTFVFGPEKSNLAHRIVDYKRVEQLVEGFGEYTTSASGALLGKESIPRTKLLEGAADQLLDLVLTEEETPLQQILLEQLAKIMASTSRSVFTQLRERSGVLPSGRTVLGSALDPLGLWRTSPLVRMNELDERTVETTRNLISLVQRQIAERDGSLFDLTTLSRQEIVQLSSILVRKVWDRRRGVVHTSGRFARQLLQLTADKLERGERDTRRLPERPQQQVPRLATPAAPRSLEALQPNPLSVKRSFESSRLQQARRRLEELQYGDIPDAAHASDDF